MRPSKDKYYLNIAKSVCERSTCLRRKFGAIIVKDDVIVSTGYNGPPRGVINCSEIGCLKDKVNAPHYSEYRFCIAVHAEENAILNAARQGSSVLGGTLYVLAKNANDDSISESRPCDRCKRAIINSGIESVVTMKKDGTIKTYDVRKWVEKESKNYVKKVKEASGEKSPIFRRRK